MPPFPLKQEDKHANHNGSLGCIGHGGVPANFAGRSSNGPLPGRKLSAQGRLGFVRYGATSTSLAPQEQASGKSNNGFSSKSWNKVDFRAISRVWTSADARVCLYT